MNVYIFSIKYDIIFFNVRDRLMFAWLSALLSTTINLNNSEINQLFELNFPNTYQPNPAEPGFWSVNGDTS